MELRLALPDLAPLLVFALKNTCLYGATMAKLTEKNAKRLARELQASLRGFVASTVQLSAAQLSPIQSAARMASPPLTDAISNAYTPRPSLTQGLA